MICLGFSPQKKSDVIQDYCDRHSIKKVFVLSPKKLFFSVQIEAPFEVVEWAEIIMYKIFYRLLQEIDKNTLVVVNECLRTQNRSDLTYNCIRHYLAQTFHQIVFQWLPIIDGQEDFMTLLDFDTQSRYKQQGFSTEKVQASDLMVNPIMPVFSELQVKASAKLKSSYEKKKSELFQNIGAKDPHTIPRNLYLLGGKEKLPMVIAFRQYVGRNNRFKLSNLRTYKDAKFAGTNVVFEFPHNHIEFNDFMYLSGQSNFEVLTTDLKVDQWYLDRYTKWAKDLSHVYSAIQQVAKCA